MPHEKARREEAVTDYELILSAALFVPALLGHLVGDYLLQSKWMALTKSQSGSTGSFACTVHVLVYTAAVCIMLRATNPWIWLLVALPHWIIDRWSLGEAWLRLIRGRTAVSAAMASEPRRSFNISFYALVYAVVDNTFHLLSLWFVIVYVLV